MINNFRDKHARIKVIQEKADFYNSKFDDLEKEGVNLEEIPKIISQEDKSMRHTRILGGEEVPFEKYNHIITNTGRLGQGNHFITKLIKN